MTYSLLDEHNMIVATAPAPSALPDGCGLRWVEDVAVLPDQDPGEDETLSLPMITVTATHLIRTYGIRPLRPAEIADRRRARRADAMGQALDVLSRHRNQRDYDLPTALTDEQAAVWAAHLQALRDYPETGIWPDAPR